MNKIELTAALISDLKENAEKATPGPWVMEIDDFDEDIIKITSLSRQKESKVEIASIPFTENENCSPNEFVQEQRRNADYLHAANPAVVLALIGRIHELEKSDNIQALTALEMIYFDREKDLKKKIEELEKENDQMGKVSDWLAKALVNRGHILGCIADNDLHKNWLQAARKAVSEDK